MRFSAPSTRGAEAGGFLAPNQGDLTKSNHTLLKPMFPRMKQLRPMIASTLVELDLEVKRSGGIIDAVQACQPKLAATQEAHVRASAATVGNLRMITGSEGWRM
jgi:hypothetical protein